MQILSLLLALAKLLNIGIKYADDRQLLNAGAKTAIADQLATGMKMVTDANKIRQDTAADDRSNLDWLRNPKNRSKQ